jgi:hypothetical protein
MLDTFARPVAVVRQRTNHTAYDGSVELHEMDGFPGLMVFRCERLHLELTPGACAKSYRTPRSDACVDCRIGARHEREAEPTSVQSKRSRTPPPVEVPPDESDIQDRLARRAALRATGGQSAALSCIRCQKTAMTNQRLIGRMRLLREHTICVSCYNREREIRIGANAKGGRPKVWAGKLFETHLVCVEAGAQKRVSIGLTTGVDEAKRYFARARPASRVIGVFVADDFHLLIAPRSEGLALANRERRRHIAAREKSGAEACRVEQALDDPKTTGTHAVSAECAVPAATVPRKLAVGVRIGLLVLQRDVGRSQWVCRCDCGKQTALHATALRGTREPSCGCTSRSPAIEKDPTRQPAHEAPKVRRTPTVVAGMQRGHLTALRYVRESKWRWRCVCGSERTIESGTALARKIRHCGCGGKKRADAAPKPADERLRAFYASMPAVVVHS